MTARRPMAVVVLVALFVAALARADDPQTDAQSVTAAELFPPAQSASLSYTLDPARRVTFRVRVPPGDAPHGVLVFVSPRDDAEPREGWAEVLDRRNLAWIAPRASATTSARRNACSSR